MSHQFKPGDLAVTLVDGFFFPVMAQVELIKPVFPAGFWQVGRGGVTSVYREQSLMPLRGDFEPEKQKAKEVDHVHLV